MRGCFGGQSFGLLAWTAASVGLGRFQVIERVPNAFTPCDPGGRPGHVSVKFRQKLHDAGGFDGYFRELLVKIAMLTVWAGSRHLRGVVRSWFIPCLSGCHPQPLAVVSHGHSPAWQSFGSHNRSQSSSDFFPTTRPAPPTWKGSLERRVSLSAEEYLPIIHLVFANLKTWLNGIHPGSLQHLQAYLTNSPSASTSGSIRSTPSVPCSASRATSPHRLRRALLRSLAASYM